MDQEKKSNSNFNRSEKPHKNPRVLSFLLALLIATGAGFVGGYYGNRQADNNNSTNSQVAQETFNSEGNLISQIVRDVGPSVVSVGVEQNVRQQTAFGDRNLRTIGAGTGFIVSKDGVVLTNRHVVPKGANNISITLSDGTKLDEVEVIGRTSQTDPLDVAFLKIKNTKGKELVPAKLGDSTKVQVGDKVIAIGNALGQFQNTVTSGIISGYGRSIEAGDSTSSETLQNLFQTDASINQGNSGGPLVNAAGEVIGINTAVADAENIGFAIPITDTKGLIDSVLTKGKLERPYLGVRYINLNDGIAYEYNLNTSQGAYVAPNQGSGPAIVPDSPAAKAGLQEKDIITKVNDITVDDKVSLASVLGRFSAGDTVTLTVVRGDETMTVDATLGSSPTE